MQKCCGPQSERFCDIEAFFKLAKHQHLTLQNYFSMFHTLNNPSTFPECETYVMKGVRNKKRPNLKSSVRL